MHEYYGLLTCRCDTEDPDLECWGERLVQVSDGEKKEDAIKLVVDMGWELDEDGFCWCPYCNKGIKEKDTNLKRIK